MDIRCFDSHSYRSETFKDISAENAEIDRVEFEDCTFRNCRFSATTFTQCRFIDCSFFGCDMNLMKIPSCRFSSVEFERCKMESVMWNTANWSRLLSSGALKFHECFINSSSFSDLSLEGISIENCQAHAVDFRGGSFLSANFSFTDFTGALFGKTDLTGADFTEAVDYDIDIFSNAISKAKFSRYEAARMLYSLDVELVD